jgi:hypothetical protein
MGEKINTGGRSKYFRCINNGQFMLIPAFLIGLFYVETIPPAIFLLFASTVSSHSLFLDEVQQLLKLDRRFRAEVFCFIVLTIGVAIILNLVSAIVVAAFSAIYVGFATLRSAS